MCGPGCRLNVIQAGTTSAPQNAYQDSGLTIPLPNPLICDSAGRLPAFFVADGLIKLRLTTSTGSQVFIGDNLLVVGPSSGGGGGGGTVDPTTIFQTGAFMQFYGTGPITGWVRCNGRTIGSSTSGASERANSDAQALFEYLWGADSNLAVSGGRGASANADWTANKTLTLPDCRGRALSSLDDMGNSAAGRLTASYFGTSATVLGAAGGAENVAMALANLIQHTHNNTLTDPGHVHGGIPAYTGVQANAPRGGNAPIGFTNSSSATTGITINNAAAGSASPTPMRTVQPTILVTTYLKL
jgi:hypothetical protein